MKQAKRFGLRTYFPGPVYVAPWMTGNDVGPYVDWAMAMLKRWQAKGLEPALYAPLNEPEINNDYSPQWLHDVVVQLGQRLRANTSRRAWRSRFVASPCAGASGECGRARPSSGAS